MSAPSFANRTATARPIPLSPPVISAILPRSFRSQYIRGHRSAVAAAFCTDDQVAFAGAEAAEFYFPLAYKGDFRRSRVPQPCAFVKEHAAEKKLAKIRLTPGWLGLFFLSR